MSDDKTDIATGDYEGWENRLLQERAELKCRLIDLHAYIEKLRDSREERKALGAAGMILLLEQCRTMVEYERALSRRARHHGIELGAEKDGEA